MTTEWKPPKIKHNKPTKWHWIVSHPENLKLGKNTDIGVFTYIQSEHGVEIEENVQIGGGCKIYSKNSIDKTQGKIIIRKNTCIGANSVILPKKDSTPLIIGENSIIGALSLIKEDIPSNTVYIQKRS